MAVTASQFERKLAAVTTMAAARDLFGVASRDLGYEWFDAIAMTASLISTPRKATRFFTCNYYSGDALAFLPSGWPGDDEITARAARSSRPINYLEALKAAGNTPSILLQRGTLKMFGVKRAWLFPHSTLGEFRCVTCYMKESKEDIEAQFLATRDVLFSMSAVFIDRLDELHRADAGEDQAPFIIGKMPIDLTTEEWACYVLLVRGKTNPEIAEELELSVNTVKFHLKKVFKKLNVQTRAQAMAVALDHGVG